MFINKIKRMRKNIRNEKWLHAKLEILIDYSEYIYRFKCFDCESEFVGGVKANHNLIWWEKQFNKNNKQIKFIKKMLEEV